MKEALLSNHGAYIHSQCTPLPTSERQHPSLHLQELHKISCLLCHSHSNWQRKKNRLLTQTQATHSLTAALVSLWMLMRKWLKVLIHQNRIGCGLSASFSTLTALHKSPCRLLLLLNHSFMFFLPWWMFTQYLLACLVRVRPLRSQSLFCHHDQKFFFFFFWYNHISQIFYCI